VLTTAKLLLEDTRVEEVKDDRLDVGPGDDIGTESLLDCRALEEAGNDELGLELSEDVWVVLPPPVIEELVPNGPLVDGNDDDRLPDKLELEDGTDTWFELLLDGEAVEEVKDDPIKLDVLEDPGLNDEVIVLDCVPEVTDEEKLNDPANVEDEIVIPQDVGEALKPPVLDEEEPLIPRAVGEKLEIPVMEDGDDIGELEI
jgi:hypothetical protein